MVSRLLPVISQPEGNAGSRSPRIQVPMTTLIDAPPSDADALLAVQEKSRPAGGLGQYILIRFLLIFPTILILVTLVFFLMRITGDPITAAMGGRLPPEQLQERIHTAGYDRPLLLQYFEYLGQLVTGNFGTTLSDNRKVTEMLTTYGSATLELAINALIVRSGGRHPAGHDRRPPSGPPAGRRAAHLRHPLLRHPGLLRRPAAEADVLCLAGLASGGRPRQDQRRNWP